MQLKFLNSLVFILIEVILLPGLFENRSEICIHLLTPLVQFLPIWTLFSLSEACQQSFLSASLRRKEKKSTIFIHQDNLKSERQVVVILDMTFLQVLPPTASYTTLLAVPTWQHSRKCDPLQVFSAHTSASQLKRLEEAKSACRICYPFLAASLVWRGEGKPQAGSAVKNWQGLQHLPHG